jgi:hypothetical protein
MEGGQMGGKAHGSLRVMKKDLTFTDWTHKKL